MVLQSSSLVACAFPAVSAAQLAKESAPTTGDQGQRRRIKAFNKRLRCKGKDWLADRPIEMPGCGYPTPPETPPTPSRYGPSLDAAT